MAAADDRTPRRTGSPTPAQGRASVRETRPSSPFLRAENEDDDGYDPYSDRPSDPEPRFEPDPWR